MKVLAVIPARGGSKRLPRKNIMNLGGNPLISYTIRVAQRSKMLSSFVVSTEDKEIAEIAERYMGPLPFLRPKKLALDSVRNSQTMIHALDWCKNNKGENFDAVMLLQPTAPLRQSWHIDEAIDIFQKSQQETLASVTGPHKKRDVVIKSMSSNNVLSNYFPGDPNSGYFKYNASIYIVRTKYLREKQMFTSKDEIGYLMSEEYSADIDYEIDFYRAESDLKYLREKNKCEF